MSEADDGLPGAGGRGGAALDIALVLTLSGAALLAELQARNAGYLTLGPETTGLFAVLAGTAVALGLVLIRGRSFAELGFRRPRRLWTLPLWAVGIFVVYVAAQVLVPQLLAPFVEMPKLDLSRYDNLYQNLPLTLLAVTVIPLTAAIPEEIIYRGFLLGRFNRIFGPGLLGALLAVLAQGALFGLAHFQWGPGGMLLTTVMGLVWGTAFLICSRNLWIVIAAHSLGDVILMAQLYFVKGSEITAG